MYLPAGAFIACLALVVRVAGIVITHPTQNDIWTTSGPNTISWTTEKGDPEYINIQLSHNNVTNFQPIPGLLSADGLIATGIAQTSRYLILSPSCITGNPLLPTGPGYSLRFLSETQSSGQTLLNSTVGSFTIIPGDVTMCAGLGNDTTTSTGGAPSSSTTAIANSSVASTSSHHRAGAVAGGVIGGLVFCALLAAGVVFYNRYHQKLRQRQTQQFVMRRGLSVGTPVEAKGSIPV